MKVISINAEHTVSPKQIAFNVDEELTPEFIAQIAYGSLTFRGTAKTLIVHLPDDDDSPFDSESLRTLNKALLRVAEEFERAAAKRQRMLQGIAANTGLQLA